MWPCPHKKRKQDHYERAVYSQKGIIIDQVKLLNSSSVKSSDPNCHLTVSPSKLWAGCILEGIGTFIKTAQPNECKLTSGDTPSKLYAKPWTWLDINEYTHRIPTGGCTFWVSGVATNVRCPYVSEGIESHKIHDCTDHHRLTDFPYTMSIQDCTNNLLNNPA